MSFIKYVPKEEIDPAHRVDDDDNILRVHGIHGRVMRLHYDLYVELMHRHSPLSRIQREMIAIVVSAINACEYWLVHHRRGLRRELQRQRVSSAEIESLIEALSRSDRQDDSASGIAAADQVMLGYARKLTELPEEISSADVDALRQAGFDDLAIHDICCITAYFAFVNRVADGLGVQLEPGDA